MGKRVVLTCKCKCSTLYVTIAAMARPQAPCNSASSRQFGLDMRRMHAEGPLPSSSLHTPIIIIIMAIPSYVIVLFARVRACEMVRRANQRRGKARPDETRISRYWVTICDEVTICAPLGDS